MDAIIAGVKVKVLELYPNILTDLSITDEQLDIIIENVIDRALVFTNRDQLIYRFETDLADWPMNVVANEEFWALYNYYPIPPRLYGVLAKVVYESVRTINTQKLEDNKEVKSVTDGQQSVTFGTEMSSFFSSSDDAEIFAGSLSLLKRYILPTIVGEDTRIF